jgi:hypothetical protein
MISTYYRGDIPLDPLVLSVRAQNNQQMNLTGYAVTARMIDPANKEVDLSDADLNSIGIESGVFQFVFPTNKTLFKRTGDYMLQLVIASPEGRVQKTSPYTIRVREMGKVER